MNISLALVISTFASLSCASSPADGSSPLPHETLTPSVAPREASASPSTPGVFELDRARLASIARVAESVPACNADLASRAVSKRLSTIDESELTREKPQELDWSLLTSGRFHRPDVPIELNDFDAQFGIVFVAEEKRHTTLSQLGLYVGRGIVIDTRTLEPLCSFPLRAQLESGSSKSFMDVFQAALDAAPLGPGAPRVQ